MKLSNVETATGIVIRMHFIVNAFSFLVQDTHQPLTIAHLKVPSVYGKQLTETSPTGYTPGILW